MRRLIKLAAMAFVCGCAITSTARASTILHFTAAVSTHGGRTIESPWRVNA